MALLGMVGVVLTAIACTGVLSKPAIAARTGAPDVSIRLPSPQNAMVVSPNGDYAYFIADSDTLTVLDLGTHRVHRVRLALDESQLTDLAISPSGGELLLSSDGGSVLVVNTTTLKTISTITVGESAEGVAISPDGRTGYVVTNRNVIAISIANGQVLAKAPFSLPCSQVGTMELSQDGKTLYIETGECEESQTSPVSGSSGTGQSTSKNIDGSLVILKASDLAVTAHLDTGYTPGECGFAPSPKATFVMETICTVAAEQLREPSSRLEILNPMTGKLEHSVPFTQGARSLVFNPNGDYAYVSNAQGPEIEIFNSRSDRVIRTVSYPVQSFHYRFGPIAELFNLLSISSNGKTIYGCAGIINQCQNLIVFPVPKP
jgi:YVTN family beta-propeller protein